MEKYEFKTQIYIFARDLQPELNQARIPVVRLGERLPDEIFPMPPPERVALGPLFQTLERGALIQLFELILQREVHHAVAGWRDSLYYGNSTELHLLALLLARLAAHCKSNPEGVRGVVSAILEGSLYEGDIEEFRPRYLKKGDRTFWFHGLSAYSKVPLSEPEASEELDLRVQRLLGPVSLCVANQAIGPIGVVVRGDLLSLYEGDCHSIKEPVRWNVYTGELEVGRRNPNRPPVANTWECLTSPKASYVEGHLRTREVAAVWWTDSSEEEKAEALAKKLGVPCFQVREGVPYSVTSGSVEEAVLEKPRPLVLKGFKSFGWSKVYLGSELFEAILVGDQIQLSKTSDPEISNFEVSSFEVDFEALTVSMMARWKVLLPSGWTGMKGQLCYGAVDREHLEEAVRSLEAIPAEEDYWWEVQDRLERSTRRPPRATRAWSR